jgi:hypothetical protein
MRAYNRRGDIQTYRTALSLASRTDRPLDWAATQNDLGAALASLGERESSTERLEERSRPFARP